ncbi:aminopeptidase N [Cenarchaeum symbiosum A]|uniref:Aminopeptidase n=1 Tax=Cenarchaeum symbiosum (strain A) TaxID=414004 RepID=A0RUU6_CENSY|nr:aminopeptidase N [Cenarchaeum symbiosum A]
MASGRRTGGARKAWQKAPMSYTPENYRLDYVIDLDKLTFSCSETVRVAAPRPTSEFKLHSADLSITKASIDMPGRTVPAKIIQDEKAELLLLRSAEKVSGRCKLNIEFAGKLKDELRGLYLSRYKSGKKTKHLATTQFEAADARRAFPCWDEPEAKATFDISITTGNKNTAISNMPETSKKRSGPRTKYVFATTPVMSTYLVYLGAGEFEFVSGKHGNVTVRVAATAGKIRSARYALDLGKSILGEYEKYFGAKYPLPKLDLIAIPDFAAGAMENWGAITFREALLLYDPKSSTTRTKQLIAEVISHEIAHQWFGNLVTMKWWNDLWLNESFATFMATKILDKIYPEWELWEQFVGDAMPTAMALDALKSSHPIDVKVREPSEIREIFDAISYDKGGCILRMLEEYVTAAKFRRGLRAYIKKFAYGNAEGGDLWDAIGRESGRPVRRMMEGWIGQTGFPVVEAARHGSTMRLKQRRFLMGPRGKAGGRWSIPVTIGRKKPLYRTLMEKESASIPVSGGELVLNHGRYGFYRAKYDQSCLLDLKYAVESKAIPHIDRWAVQDDLYALCLAGEATLSDYLDMADAYSNEGGYLAAMGVSANLNSIRLRTYHEPYYHMIQARCIRHYTGMHSRLGWDARKGEAHTDALLRGLVISVLGRMGDEGILEEARRRFAGLRRGRPLPADLREAVYSVIAWNGGAKEYKEIAAMYEAAPTEEERTRLLGALCHPADSKLLQKTLDYSLGAAVRPQNMHIPAARIAANPHGTAIVWPWMKKNWTVITKKTGTGNPLLNRIVGSLSLVADKKIEEEARLFYKRNPAPGTEMTLRQALEASGMRRAFLARASAEFGA